MTSREKSWLAALVIVAILALVELFYIPGDNQLLYELNNVCHIPVFGILAVAMLHLVKVAAPGTRQKPWLAYGAAFAAASSLGVVSEAIQYFSPRDADLFDLVRDVVGAASFLALYAAIRDRDLREAREKAAGLRKRLLTLTAVLWLLGGWSLLAWSAAFAHRSLAFPVLCDFDSVFSTRFLDPHGVSLDCRVSSEATGMLARGTRVRFDRGSWPGVEVFDIYPDWTGYDSLILELSVEGDYSLPLCLAVYDRRYSAQADDRYSRGFALDPGRQRIAVALVRIVSGPQQRKLDMTEVDGVEIFSDSSAVGKSVLLEQLYLK